MTNDMTQPLPSASKVSRALNYKVVLQAELCPSPSKIFCMLKPKLQSLSAWLDVSMKRNKLK